MGMGTFLKSNIPSVKIPKSAIIERADVAEANNFDYVRTNDFDRAELKGLLDELKKLEFAVTLEKELRGQLAGSLENQLEVGTYKRLSRWLHPRRWTRREKEVQPVAEGISRLLFGEIIDRVDG